MLSVPPALHAQTLPTPYIHFTPSPGSLSGPFSAGRGASSYLSSPDTLWLCLFWFFLSAGASVPLSAHMADSRLLQGRVTSDWSLYPSNSPSPEPCSEQTNAHGPFLQLPCALTLSFPAGKAHVEGHRGDDAVCGESEEDV